MKAQTVSVKESTGRVLSCTIFRGGGKKLLAKGHVISDEDINLLEVEGMNEVWVAELEAGEVGEDDAVMMVTNEIACGAVEIRRCSGGRANLIATEPCCALIDGDLLKQINCTASMAIATVSNFTYAAKGQRMATVKSAPFAVPADQLETIVSILKERGPILQGRPIQNPSVAVLYSDPAHGERARVLCESVIQHRLEALGAKISLALVCVEDEDMVTRSLQHILTAKPTTVLIASTTAPAGPGDVIGRAMARVGCSLERFLAPVEPGNLLLLGYKDDIPVVSAPGCFRSGKPNVLDLLLPPMLARYRVSGWEIACLGHGGLLS
jgi:molybdenum cofactor cytidylyltransferase